MFLTFSSTLLPVITNHPQFWQLRFCQKWLMTFHWELIQWPCNRNRWRLEVPIPYFLGLFFRPEFQGISPQFIWPKIWYSTTSTSICWILDFPLTESHNPCSIISMAMGPFSFNDSADQPAASSTPFCGADGQVIWEDHPPIHDWLVVEPPTPLKNMS